MSQLTALKLRDKVVAHLEGRDPLQAHEPKPAELTTLWESCTSKDSVECCASCDALVSLVMRCHLDFSYTLNNFLNLIPSAKNLSGLSRALTDLLVIQVISATKDGSTFTVPYGIRIPPHPYISLLTQRSDSWQLLQQQIHRFLHWPDPQIHPYVIPLLAPVLRFILLEPLQSEKFTTARLAVIKVILVPQNIEVIRHDLCHLLSDLLPCFQVGSASQVAEATLFASDILRYFTVYDDLELDIMSGVVENCLSLVQLLIKFGQDPTFLLESLHTFLTRHSQMCQRILMPLSELLLSSPGHLLPNLLHLVSLVLDHVTNADYMVASLILPMMHIISTPPVNGSCLDRRKTSSQLLATQLVTKIEQHLLHVDAVDMTKSVEKKYHRAGHCLIPQVKTLQSFEQLSDLFTSSETCRDWLKSLDVAMEKDDGHLPEKVLPLLVGICIASKDDTNVKLSLELFVKMCEKQPQQAASLFTVCMYKLSSEDNPEMKMKILYTIPRLATHKGVVPPILKTIQMLGASAELKPVAVRLMTKLWQKQERCFPHLQKMLHDIPIRGSRSKDVNENLLAKATSIRDICLSRPHVHGADMLPDLSAILNECTQEQDAVPAALALQALTSLCQVEVIDIRSVWSVLSGSLTKDKRPLVQKHLCEFFALVPQLAVNTPEYEKFTEEVIIYLWELALSPVADKDTETAPVSAAFEALSMFDREVFTLDHLPEKVTDDVRQAAIASADPLDGPPVVPAPPGVCYTRLLSYLPSPYMEGVSKLVSALVRKEVDGLLRNVYTTAASQRRPGSHAQHRSVSAIPQTIRSAYDACHNPAIRPSLAFGVLLSFDPELKKDHDNKPNKMSIVTHGRSYHQTFYSLLTEVSVGASDWLASAVLPIAWMAFMDRLFDAYHQMRQADLELELQRGRVNDLQEHEIKSRAAWLWARDKLVDLIKSTSKGSPAAQANCVCALSGLIMTLVRHVSGIDADTLRSLTDDAPEHLTHRHWLNIATQTLMSIMDPSFKSTVRTWPMCNQRIGGGGAASVMARAISCEALAIVIPVISSTTPDAILQLLAALQRGLPGQPDAEHSSLLQQHHGLGLGMVLAALVEHQFIDAAGTEGLVALWGAMNALEAAAFGDHPNREGCLLGTTICASALCSDGKVDSRVHVGVVVENLSSALDACDINEDCSQIVCVSLASCVSAAYAANLLGEDIVNGYVAKLYELHMTNPQSQGACLSAGLLCCGLLRVNHPTVTNLAQKLYSTWISTLQDQNADASERHAAASGIMALSGIHSLWLPATSEMQSDAQVVDIPEVIKSTNQIIRSQSSDVGLQSVCGWMLGCLYSSVCQVTETRSSVSNTYQYLGEVSLLRPLVDTLVVFGKGQVRSPEQISEIECIIRMLIEAPRQPLPPLNWAYVQSPLLRLSNEGAVQKLSIELLLSQCVSSPGAAMLLSCWLHAPLLYSLNASSLDLLYDELSRIIKCVQVAKLEMWLKYVLLPLFTSPSSVELQVKVLLGLERALAVPDPPASVTPLLRSTLQEICEAVSHTDQELLPVYCALGQCLQQLPQDEVDSFTHQLPDVASIKDLCIRCLLVARGVQPLQWLNTAVEMFMYWPNENMGLFSWLMGCSFHGVRHTKSGNTADARQQQWLLELMGHMRNLATGIAKLPDGADLPQVLEFSMRVIATALVGLADVGAEAVLGFIHLSNHVNIPTHVHDRTLSTILSMLPVALETLLLTPAWLQVTPKILDWLLQMCEVSLKNEWRQLMVLFLECLYTLRQTKDFKKMAVWSKAFTYTIPTTSSSVSI